MSWVTVYADHSSAKNAGIQPGQNSAFLNTCVSSISLQAQNSTQSDEMTMDCVQTAGEVATQLWEEWQSNAVEADVFNVNVPLGFKTVEGTPVKPEILRTTVDMQSQYSSLYSKPLRSCMAHCPNAAASCQIAVKSLYKRLLTQVLADT